mmetsp:Transcript_24108/g.33804  ORF Transcript_24108/g.33804 Transcript_24108/m.33804 type:complete len:421 (-) Transcript_24108:22-1284(-)
MKLVHLFGIFVLVWSCYSTEIRYAGTPNDASLTTAWNNADLMNKTLQSLQPGDTFIIPNTTYYVMGGIKAANLENVIIQIDGTVTFSTHIETWPTYEDGNVLQCFEFQNLTNVIFTSSGAGTLNGNGAVWWGAPGLGYVVRGENRPKLLDIGNSKNILVENIYFIDSPYWTFWAHEIDGLEVRYCHVSAKRDYYDGHDIYDLTAFNTDGFDVSGKNVWIHHSSVWNQDDCFCVKDNSENMLFEDINASGLGLVIGSIGGSTVRNITFRNAYMPHTYKGVYMKFRSGGGLIEDVLYENIVMDSPEQWPIWIGPAQQSDSSELCAAHPCSLCWPMVPSATCAAPEDGQFIDITLRNVTINYPPSQGTGVIIGSEKYPMQNITFDGVIVNHASSNPDYYACEGVETGIAQGGTWPVPPCFTSQ